MTNVVRYSQLLGLLTIDGATGTRCGYAEELWMDGQGRVVYLSSQQGYVPLEHILRIDPDIVLASRYWSDIRPRNLHALHQRPIDSNLGETIGWIEDFLFDWQTGEVVAYVVGGELARPYGEFAILDPRDVAAIDTRAVVLREGASRRLKSEAEGLTALLNQTSKTVKRLAKTVGDRLQTLRPDFPAVHPKSVHIPMDVTGDRPSHENAPLKQWQHQMQRMGKRTKAALGAAWEELTKRSD